MPQKVSVILSTYELCKITPASNVATYYNQWSAFFCLCTVTKREQTDMWCLQIICETLSWSFPRQVERGKMLQLWTDSNYDQYPLFPIDKRLWWVCRSEMHYHLHGTVAYNHELNGICWKANWQKNWQFACNNPLVRIVFCITRLINLTQFLNSCFSI